MNRYYYLCPLFEKSENIQENIKSENIVFLKFAFFQKVKVSRVQRPGSSVQSLELRLKRQKPSNQSPGSRV